MITGNEKINNFREVVHKSFNNIFLDAIKYYREAKNKTSLINSVFYQNLELVKYEGRIQIFGGVASLFTYTTLEYAHMLERVDYNEIIDELIAILIKKNTQYGDSFFNMMIERGIESGFDRLQDKINRYNTLYNHTELSDFESLSDTVLDIMGYCYLILVFLHYDYVEKIRMPRDAIKLILDIEYYPDINFEYIGSNYANLITELSKQSTIHLCELYNTAKNTYTYTICLANKNKNNIKAIVDDFIKEIKPKAVRHIYNCSNEIR